jgi:uncharacterized membrane protein (UPF0127 family)
VRLAAYNATRRETLVRDVRSCESFWDRLKGLLGTPALRPDEACLLHGCSSVHTFGMRYAIDVYFLDTGGHVVKMLPRMQPNRISPIVPRADAVLEVAAGYSRCVEVGDRLVFEKI